MHELSVCMALLEQVNNIAHERGATTVSKIVLKLGPLCGVEPDLLRNAYPLAAAGTIANGALLEIEIDQLVVRCEKCGENSSAAPNCLICGHCGDFHTRVVRGEEMILSRLELDCVENPALRSAGY